MSGPEEVVPGQVDDDEVIDEPIRDPDAWHRWREDQALVPPAPSPGFRGRLEAALRAALAPLFKKLWKRQIGFNLSVIDHLEAAETARFDLLRDLREIRDDLLRDVQNNHRRIAHLEAFKREGYADVMRHSDALYAVVDQKLDRYRRKSQQLWAELGSLLARVENEGSAEVASSLADQWVQGAHRRLLVDVEEPDGGIGDWVAELAAHLPLRGTVLELGCGSGGSLALLAESGLSAQGIESDPEAAAECQRRGLQVTQGDLLTELARLEPQSLAGLISRQALHRLDGLQIDRLVRLAWRVLQPGGTLILETANPMSLVAAARSFWTDPEPRRPLHPETLLVLFRQAGFEPVESVGLSPYPPDQRLPDFTFEGLPSEQQQLADRFSRLRDQLDDLLFGDQVCAVVGKKPV
jgi:SAM-dependent methyltransferase